jgi:uncharacterized protein YecE (DUF72 family)
MEKLDQGAKPASSLKVERPYSEPGIYLGTSSFTASGWEGNFYPAGMKPREFLSYYATQFSTVEVDSTFKFAVEIRNKSWLDARFADMLREHNAALVLNDTPFVPRPWEMKEQFDLVTANFSYVRWLGDRKGIERQTKTWDKAIIDRQDDLRRWVELLRRLVTDKRIRKIVAYANNHYAGHGPATVKLFWDLWTNNK